MLCENSCQFSAVDRQTDKQTIATAYSSVCHCANAYIILTVNCLLIVIKWSLIKFTGLGKAFWKVACSVEFAYIQKKHSSSSSASCRWWSLSPHSSSPSPRIYCSRRETRRLCSVQVDAQLNLRLLIFSACCGCEKKNPSIRDLQGRSVLGPCFFLFCLPAWSSALLWLCSGGLVSTMGGYCYPPKYRSSLSLSAASSRANSPTGKVVRWPNELFTYSPSWFSPIREPVFSSRPSATGSSRSGHGNDFLSTSLDLLERSFFFCA